MKNLIYTLLSILLLFSCSNSEEELTLGDLTFSDSTPEQNQTLIINYNGEDIETTGFYNIFTGDSFLRKDLSFGDDGTTKITIPSYASVIVFDMSKEFNKPHYLPIYDGQKKLQQAEPSISLYKITHRKYFVEEINLEDELAIIASFLKSSDISTQGHWLSEYGSDFEEINKNLTAELVKNYTSNFTDYSNLDEDQLTNLTKAYRLIDREKYDSLSQLVLEKYPNSALAGMLEFRKFRREQDPEKREAKFISFLNQYGQNDKGNLIYFSDFHSTEFAAKYLLEGNKKKFDFFKQYLSVPNLSNLYSSVAYEFTLNSNDKLNLAIDYSAESVSLLKNHLKSFNESNVYKPYTVGEYQKQLEAALNRAKDIYAFALEKDGQLEKAIEVQKDLLGVSVDYSDYYIELLNKTENFEEIVDVTPELIKEGLATEQVIEHYKKAYKLVNGTTDGLDEKVDELEEVYYTKYRETIKDKLIDKRIDDFTLVNLNGNNVSLSDYEGKTVVLDFWATWCAPCVSAFPGMKKVMDKFEDDDSVEFLFINAYENPKNRSEFIKDFIVNKLEYPDFHVLLDNELSDEDDYEVAKKFGVKGIPAKFIVGPDGNVKYHSAGYDNDKRFNR